MDAGKEINIAETISIRSYAHLGDAVMKFTQRKNYFFQTS